MPILDQLGVAPEHAVDVLWTALVMRAAWLLPDWIAKWQRVLHRRQLAEPDEWDPCQPPT